MYSTRQISICFRVFSLLLLSILILVISQPIQAQDPVERNVPDTSLELAAIKPGPPPEQLAAAMDIPADTLVNATIGKSDSRGTGVEDTALGDFFPIAGETFAILSTGLAVRADEADTNNNEQFQKGNASDDVSFAFPADKLKNTQGHDLIQLTLELTPPPGTTGLNFDFAFYSEEFPDYIGFGFNDAFLAELGVNKKVEGSKPFSSAIKIEGSKISSDHNFAFDPNNDVISVNAAFGFDPGNPNPDTGTTYDGTSGLLTATGCLPEKLEEGDTVVLILSITDLGDSVLDSAVFLDNFQWGNQSDCTPGVVDPEAYHISLQKEWLGLDKGRLPDNLPKGFKIMATSDLGVVECHYDEKDTLDCGNNDLVVPPGGTYTVQEFNVPAPWQPKAGAGVDSAVEFDPAKYPQCEEKQCTHIVTNKQPSPTAISLVSFEVEANDGRVMILWETGTEIDNAGFNLYRAASLEGPWYRVNPGLIAAEGDPVSGASYTFADRPGRGAFYYRLEDMDYFGSSTLHEPVLVELGAPVRVPWFRPLVPEF